MLYLFVNIDKIEKMSGCKLEMIKVLNLSNICGVSLCAEELADLSSVKTDLGVTPSYLLVAVQIFFHRTGQGQSVSEEVNFIKWLSFIDSELRHFNTGSKSYLNSLQFLENLLDTHNNLK